MPFCEFWGADYAGVSVFAVLEVSRVELISFSFFFVAGRGEMRAWDIILDWIGGDELEWRNGGRRVIRRDENDGDRTDGVLGRV